MNCFVTRLFFFFFCEQHLCSVTVCQYNTRIMLSIRCAQLLFTVWAFQCSAAQKPQTLLAVKEVNKQITIKSLPYSTKPEEIIIGKAKYIDGINSTGQVIFLLLN